MAMPKLPRVHPREMAGLVAHRIMIMLEMMMDMVRYYYGCGGLKE
jgi:hypothetical protein